MVVWELGKMRSVVGEGGDTLAMDHTYQFVCPPHIVHCGGAHC